MHQLDTSSLCVKAKETFELFSEERKKMNMWVINSNKICSELCEQIHMITTDINVKVILSKSCLEIAALCVCVDMQIFTIHLFRISLQFSLNNYLLRSSH